MDLNNSYRSNVDIDMAGIGLDISSSHKQVNDFVKKGMCPTCGAQTHKIERKVFGKPKKIPLTIEGRVINGVCMKCRHPMEAYVERAAAPQQQLQQEQQEQQEQQQQHEYNVSTRQELVPPPNSQISVPAILEVEDRSGDDCTVVSGITMDHHLLKEFGDDDSDSSSEHFKVAPGQRRPKQSFGEVDDCPPPNAPRRTFRTRANSARRNSSSSQTTKKMSKQRSLNQDSLMSGEAHQAEVFAIQEEMPLPSNNLSADGGSNNLSPHHINHSNNQTRRNSIAGRRRSKKEAFTNIFGQDNQELAALSDENDELNFAGQSNVEGEQLMPRLNSSNYKDHSLIETYSFEEEKATLSLAGESMRSERKMPFHDNYNGDASKLEQWGAAKSSFSDTQILAQIPSLLDCLKLDSVEPGVRENAFHSLAEIVWKGGYDAKAVVAEYNGIESINSCMWAAMSDPSVQEAAVHLLFALSASDDANAGSDVIIGHSAEAAVHALLFVMQSHITVESIQYTGCGTLNCLAAASSNNKEIDDGALTGAVLTVMNAMDAHRTSQRVQEWGLQALYNQCVYSSNAESNMRTLANGDGDHKLGPEIICRAIQRSPTDMVTIEWACKLCWCLSSSEDVATLLCETPLLFQEIIRIIRCYYMNPHAAVLLEASFGALGNMFNLRQNNDFIHDSEVVFHVVASMAIHSTCEGLCTEGCALIANFSSFSSSRDIFAGQANVLDIVKAISLSLRNFPENLLLFEEVLRTLSCLSIAEELDSDVKAFICSDESLPFLSSMSKRHGEHLSAQVMLCNILGSIFADRKYALHVVSNGAGLMLLFTIMKTHQMDRKIQEAACLALRNLSCHENDEIWNQIIGEEPLGLLLRAMTTHPNSEAIQLHACCALWNIFASNLQDKEIPEEPQIVDHIVRTIQTHLESGLILEMACAALWSVMDNSNERKERMVENGGIDAVTCAIVMHPNEPKTLERAFGVLSCLSMSRTFADAISNAQGVVENVVEAMRANGNVVLLEVGCLVLRNIILANNNHVTEASNVTATIINQMKENPQDSVGFQREACNLLWSMAALSKHCKEKILSLDGFSVLVNCLEYNSAYSDVQDAALGAFNQLAM